MSKRKQQQKYDYLVKVVIIGDSAVGKTNILLRYTNQEYKVTHITTIGVDFKIKTVSIDGVRIKMQIWDTAGQERFKTLTEAYYKGAAGVALVYAVNDRKSFFSLQNWIKQINATQSDTMCKLIVGNKSDISDSQRQVTYQQGKNLADQYGVKFIQTSAKQNKNITEIFMTLGADIKQKLVSSDSNKASMKKIESIKLKGEAKTQLKKKNCQC